MTTAGENREFYDRLGAFHEKLIEDLAPELIENPRLADAITERLESIRTQTEADALKTKAPPDGGLAGLVGIGAEAAGNLEATRLPQGVEDYDETVASGRILAIADLYYLYQHERIGVFRVMQKLQELFRAGTVRLSSGEGAYGLYRFDRRRILRYTKKERFQTYRRALGYTTAAPMRGAKPNTPFHGQFTQFIGAVAEYWRDKRISDVIRDRAYDPRFGSVATVRRAGLDLRNNLKHASYGHISVFRVEVLQLLDEAFRILGAPDVLRLFGADNAWDVVEEIMRRYCNQEIEASPRHRMAVSGRNIIRWLAIGHVLKSSQAQFEALLQEIANDAEEWLTSAETLGIAYRGDRKAVVPI
ncbi:MAG: hypothetical protein D6728_18320, partial [Cyanobacteria bacterium J055]